MFRRKTDLVYSTLQQVQRRMTNQTENSQSQSASKTKSKSAYNTGTGSYSKQPRPATLGPFTTPQVRRGDDPGMHKAPDQAPQQGAPAPAPEEYPEHQAQAVVGGQPYGQGILLTFPMLCVLLFLWVLSIAIAYSLGPGSGPSIDDPGLSISEGPAGSGPTEGNRQQKVITPNKGRDILVLKSVTRQTQAAISEFRAEALNLNRVARKYPDRLSPYFGVRQTSRGGLQLFFGLKDGNIGIDKKKFPKIKDTMIRSNANNGKGFPDAFWTSL